MKNKVYIISGPLGVGKSTITKMLNKKIENSIRIEGDLFKNPLDENGQLSWKEKIKLTWLNILDITKRYLEKDFNVIIDYVVEDEFDWFKSELDEYNVKIYYFILMNNLGEIENNLIKRDGDNRYLARSKELYKKFKNEKKYKNHTLNISHKSNIEVIQEITNYNCN